MPPLARRVGPRPLGLAYVALAALVWSLAGILQRQLHMNLASQLAGRAAFALLAILVFVAIAERGQMLRAFRAIGRWGLVVAVLIAVASGSFITALNDTSVANVLVIQALVPLAAALLGRLAGDPAGPRTWMAMGVAVAGFAVMAGAPSRPGLWGTVFSLITMLAFAATIVVARHKSDVSMAPATCLAQVLVLATFAPFAHVSEMGGANLGWLALLGIVQMGLGLFFLSLGARLLPAADVALISQLENVLGPVWVWLAGIERPSAATIAGGIIVICAVVFQVAQGTERSAPAPADAVGCESLPYEPAPCPAGKTRTTPFKPLRAVTQVAEGTGPKLDLRTEVSSLPTGCFKTVMGSHETCSVTPIGAVAIRAVPSPLSSTTSPSGSTSRDLITRTL